MADDASDREQNPEATAQRTDASGEPEPNRGDEPNRGNESNDGTAPEPRSGGPSGDGPPDANPGSEDDGRPAPSAEADGRAAPATEAGQPAPDPGADDRAGPEAEDRPASDAEDRTEPDADDRTEPDADDRTEPETDEQPMPSVPEDVRKYDRFKKMDGAQYDRVNEFLRARTYVTAREWAMARLCADFRTETGVEMTKIGENLPELVPFMTDTYTPQAVNQARASFEEKVRKAGATFLYGAMSDFLTADELDDLMYEVTEVAKFLLEVEGVDLSVEEELEAEERISSVMRDVRRSSDALRHDGMECPNCGHEIHAEE